MATNIGSVSCDLLDLDPRVGFQNPRTRVTSFAQPGVNGAGSRVHETMCGRFAFRAVKFDSYANLATWQQNLEALIDGSKTTSAEDTGGASYSNLEVLQVRSGVRRAVYESGTSKYRQEVMIAGKVHPT